MIVRLYTGSDGESYFEDLPLDYHPQGPGARTETENVEGIQFRRQELGTFMDFHNAPRKQYLVSLSGQVEIGLGSGEKRIFGPGDVMLADDLSGHGHTTRVVGSEPRISIVIPV